MHGMKEVALRRDETVLERSGIISLGKSAGENRESCLEFSVQRGNSQVASRALMQKRAYPLTAGVCRLGAVSPPQPEGRFMPWKLVR